MTEKVSSSIALELLSRELKSARMEKGFSLDDISRQISVQKNYLEKIEEGDFSFLPKAYIFTYLKKYALLMGVGNDETLEQCKKDLQLTSLIKRDIPVERDSAKTEHRAIGDKPRRNVRLPGSLFSFKVGVLLAVCAGLVIFYFTGKGHYPTHRSSAPVTLPSASADDTVAVAEQIVDSLMITSASKPAPTVGAPPPDHSSPSRVDSSSTLASVPAEPPTQYQPKPKPKPQPQPQPQPSVAPSPAHAQSEVSDSAKGSKKWAEKVSFVQSKSSSPYRKVLVVRMLEDCSWVKVIADDSARVYPGGQFKSGQVLRYEARDKFWVNIGRPKYVELYLNGKKLPPFTDRTLILN